MTPIGPRGTAVHPDTFDTTNGPGPVRVKQVEPKNIEPTHAKNGPKGLNKPPDTFSE